MTNVWKFSDWFVVTHINGALIAGTVYIFKSPSPAVFATWAAFVGTVISFYHFMVVRDDKMPDVPASGEK